MIWLDEWQAYVRPSAVTAIECVADRFDNNNVSVRITVHGGTYMHGAPLFRAKYDDDGMLTSEAMDDARALAADVVRRLGLGA